MLVDFRVAMISLHTSPLAFLGRTRDAGGMNVYVRELARELGRTHISVDIFTRQARADVAPIEQIAESVRLIHIPAGPAVALPPTELYPYVGEFTRRVAHVAEHSDHGYDLVHSHYWLSAVAGMSLAHDWDVPHVTMYHTVERLKGPQQGAPADVSAAAAVRIEQEARIACEADAIIVSTDHEAENLRRLFGLPPSTFHVIPCGVDLHTFREALPAERHAAHRALSPDGTPVLLFVGRLDPIKGIDLLLDSVAAMRTQARLVVIGGNPDGDPEVDRLRAQADALGIGERVLFPGAVAQRELPFYYAGSDAVVVTSRYESFGLVAAEALACGTPVVASQAGGLPSIVRDGENGLLVRWRCPGAFAERLDELLTDRDLAARLAAQARPSIERLGWERIGNRVRALYSELACQPRLLAAGGCS